MQKRQLLALAAAAGLGLPAMSYAVPVLSFTWEVSIDSGLTYQPVTGPITLVPGTTDYLGMLVNLNGTNPNPAHGGPYDTGTHLQPAFLGLTSYGFGITNSLGTTTSSLLDPSTEAQDGNPNGDIANGGASALPGPYTTASQGNQDGAGGIASQSLTGGFIANAVSVNSTSKAANTVGYGGNANAEIFRDLGLIPGTVGGTVTYTPTVNSLSFNYTTNATVGTATTASTYGQASSPYTTSIPNLVVITPASAPAGHNIISLVAGNGTAGANYGAADGTIAVGGPGHSSYLVTPATPFTPGATGSTNVSGFNPTTDTEIYGLKLLVGGNAPTQTQLSQIVTDINSGTGDNVTAGLIGSLPAVFTSVFTTATSGYNLFLTSTNGFTATGGSDLGFDFSQETNVAGVTVAGIAAVPEPATAAGIVLGAAGLLLGRRRHKAVVA